MLFSLFSLLICLHLTLYPKGLLWGVETAASTSLCHILVKRPSAEAAQGYLRACRAQCRVQPQTGEALLTS